MKRNVLIYVFISIAILKSFELQNQAKADFLNTLSPAQICDRSVKSDKLGKNILFDNSTKKLIIGEKVYTRLSNENTSIFSNIFICKDIDIVIRVFTFENQFSKTLSMFKEAAQMNISPAVLGHGITTNGFPYIILEYIEGNVLPNGIKPDTDQFEMLIGLLSNMVDKGIYIDDSRYHQFFWEQNKANAYNRAWLIDPECLFKDFSSRIALFLYQDITLSKDWTGYELPDEFRRFFAMKLVKCYLPYGNWTVQDIVSIIKKSSERLSYGERTIDLSNDIDTLILDLAASNLIVPAVQENPALPENNRENHWQANPEFKKIDFTSPQTYKHLKGKPVIITWKNIFKDRNKQFDYSGIIKGVCPADTFLLIDDKRIPIRMITSLTQIDETNKTLKSAKHISTMT